MADKTILNGQYVKAALVELVEVGLGRRQNMIDNCPTKKMKFVHVGMYFIALMLVLLFLMMCRY